MIEFVKENQVPFENRMPLNMGQLMSIPFILTGVYLIYASRRMPRSRCALKAEILLAADRRLLRLRPQDDLRQIFDLQPFRKRRLDIRGCERRVALGRADGLVQR